MIKGTAIHIFFGLLLSFLMHPLAIAFAFWMREFGELKSDIPGSIWSMEKIIAMLKASFSPAILVQWIAPGLAALGLQAII